MRDIKSMLPEEIAAALKEMGHSAFRGKQIFSWLSKGVTSFEEMTNLPKALRQELAEAFDLTAPKLVTKRESTDGTVKHLWALADGSCVETVFMRYDYGNTVCISTQVGCRMGCAFCASTLGGLSRNMTAGEMLDEVLFTQLATGEKVDRIVLMGIGEPLDNFDSVSRFLKLVNHPEGLNIGMRHISLSTCGLTEQFDKLADLNLQLTLSVSLHAADDETRSKLMPVNRSQGGVEALMAACERYYKKTGRRISFEYAMIDGVNDTKRHAELLAQRARRVAAHVNIIPLNKVEERPLQPSRAGVLKAFVKILEDKGVNVTVRRRKGEDVDAACGQLRRREKDQA